VGDVSTMDLIGGNLAIDFVNTLGGLPERADDEYLFGFEDLLVWSERAGVVAAGDTARLRMMAADQARAARAFDAALALRSALDRVLRARVVGGTEAEAQAQAQAQDYETLAGAYRTAIAHAGLAGGGGGAVWQWPGGTALEEPVWRLAVSAVDLLLQEAPLPRLRRCGHCRWLFLDTSPNHSRRWCSMSACGSVMKMRRYRSARRPPAGQPLGPPQQSRGSGPAGAGT
jgi:predicted RNA-binding Zn ribbon-like protein